MKLNPAEAPLYGECVLTVQLEDNEACPSPQEEEEGGETIEFYLLFSGSSQRHLTSTIRISHVTLQAVCPGHNVCEQVMVVLCVARSNGAVITCSQENFTFIQDLALDAAHLLLSSTSHQDAPLLNDPKECKKLDESLGLALKHLTQLQRLGPCSSAQPHIHSLREDLLQQKDNHENITQTHSEEHSTETEQGTVGSTQQCNCLTEHQQHSGLLHLAAADSLSKRGSFIPQQPGERDTLRSAANQGPSTDCEDTSQDHQQQLQLITHSDIVDLNEELHVDPDGRVFQHHSKLDTFTLTLPSLEKWEHKPGTDYCLQDAVAQLRKHIQQHKDKKGKLDLCGTINATAASPSTCYNLVNPKSSVEGNRGDNGSAKPAHDCLVQRNSQLENTAAGTVGCVSQRQETGGTPVARTGRNRRNKKRTAKSTRAVTESPGSPPVAAKGTARDSIPETKTLSSPEQAREITFTENEPQKDLSQIPTSAERDEQNHSRKTVASPATTIVEKQEEEKSEVEQIILAQVSLLVKEPGHAEDLQTKECMVISRQEGATERKETMGQDQSQNNPEKHSEKATSPEARKRIHSQTDLDGSTAVLEEAAWYQGGDNDSREETKSQSVWYDSEQLEENMSGEKAFSSPQLSEQCVSSCQLSPTLSQPHATGLKPTVSHGSASQRQEVHGSQQDEEAGPDWEKAGREEVSTHSKKSSENEEEDDRQGHRDKDAKCRKKKRKKRGKRGGTERNQLSSTSSIESQSHIEILTQVTGQNIQNTDLTGRTEIPAPIASVPGKTEKDTMHLPNQAGKPRDGTNLNFSSLESDLTELSGTTDFNLLGEPSEDKNTFHEITELVQETAAAQPEEMDIRTTENVETSASQSKKRELFDCKDNFVSENKDYTGQVLQDESSENSPTELLVNHADLSQLNSDTDKTVLVQFVDKPLQLGYPSENSPEISEPVGAYDSPIDGTTDVPPPQTREGSTEIVAEGLSGHCLASEMLGHQSLKEENKNELWKKEEAKIGSLQRREEMELCSNNVAQVEEGPVIENELELAATAVAVVNVAIASAMAKLEISQKLAKSCTETAGINPLLQEKTDETPAPFNKVNYSVNTGPFTQDVNKDQPHGESQKAETENSEQQHNELNIASAQETDSKQPDGTNQALMQLHSNEETDNDLPAKNCDSSLHQTINFETTTTTDKQHDSSNQEPFMLSSNEQNKLDWTAEENSVDIFENKCDGPLSSDTNNETSVDLQMANEVFDKIPDSCPVLDTGQESLPTEPVLEEIDTEIIEEGLPANDEVDIGCLMLERSISKESGDTSLSQSDDVQLSVEEQTLALSCDLVSQLITHESDQCPEDNALVEFETGVQSSQQNVPDSEEAVVMEFKDDALESLDQDVNVVDGWRERETRKNNNGEQTGSEAGIHSAQREEPASKRSVVDCLHALQIQRETDVFYSAQHCPDPSTLTAIPAESKKCPLVCLQEEDDVGQKPNTEVEDIVFKESEDRAPCTEDIDQKERVSWSSTDDASSVLGACSEEPSISTSDPNNSRLSWKSEAEDTGLGNMEGGEEEEKKDQLPVNLVSSAILRASQRSLSPSRRHSWEPGRNEAPSDMGMGQCSPLKNLSEEVRPPKTPLHRRSMSWCHSNMPLPDPGQIDNRSYSLEGLVEVEQAAGQLPCPGLSEQGDPGRGQDKDCFTKEEQQTCHQVLSVTSSCPGMFHHQTLTKSVSMVTISHREIDGMSSFTCNSGYLENSISEEEPGPLRSCTEAKGGPKISRTFSYLRNKMTKKGKEKEKDRKGEKERESKERDKKMANGHVFVPVCPPVSSCCQQCNKLLQTKECLHCSNCGVHVHKNCKDSVAVCAKNRNKLQVMAPEAASPAISTRSKSTSSTGSTVSSLSSSSRERWSTATTPEDQFPPVQPRRSPSIFTTHGNLSKSISTSNIAGLDDVTLKGLKIRSQSTDSLNQSQVNASTESLTDEGTEMIDSQIMGEFECDIKDLEADSWSSTVDKKFLKTLKKDEIKRQDVIYELYQTEFHHVRTLRIMSEVYYKGIQKELQLDLHMLEKIFPVLDDLVETHTEFLNQLLEQKRGSSVAGQHRSFLICSIGDTLVKQFSGSCAERMKKVYGKFCSRHNEAVNHYKDLLGKDKRFQNFIKKVMSSSIVRRLSIPECILLVTQRITKYPVLIQRILQHTKETDTEHNCVSEALRLVKEIITAVDCKVNEQEKKRRLKEVYTRTDSKSIMRMKSGQMFAKEDLVRGRRLLHDGALQLKNSTGRLKEVHSLLLSDVLVFLQEKDQKYVFASLDQRSTVISLQNLIVREVANEERGLFLISAGTAHPEMVEVLASSKEERNTWRAIIQDAMQCMEKDEDEGIPSETEEDRRLQESRAKEIRDVLRSKDEQIISLLEEKVHIFRELSDCSAALYDTYPAVRERMLFRATPDDVTKGEPIICEALREVESLHSLVNAGLGGAACSVSIGPAGGGVGPVCLPRRAETFGGFDSHQMNISKNGEKEEADESVDLRRTESDGVLKKGATASLQLLLKRNNEQVQSSVTHLHDLLLSLQAIVVQQDSFIEDQRQAMNERLTASSSRHSSSSSLSSTSSSRPSSLIEQEKHRSLERQRQEAASLQKQQAAHQEEKRKREREWEVKDKVLCEREEKLKEEEECAEKRRQELQEERELLQRNRDCYQREVERLKEAQVKLERDKEALRRDTERLEAQRREQAEQLQRYSRTPSITSEDSVRFPSTSSLDLDCREAAEQSKEVELSTSAPTKEPFLRIGSKRMGKNFNPFSSSSSKAQGAEKEPSRLLQLTKPKKDKKEKKKKKGRETPPTGSQMAVMSDFQNDGDNFSC